MANITINVQITGGGTMYLVAPLTQAAKNWVDENVQLEGWQWLGESFGVEHGCIEALAEGMVGDGLTVVWRGE